MQYKSELASTGAKMLPLRGAPFWHAVLETPGLRNWTTADPDFGDGDRRTFVADLAIRMSMLQSEYRVEVE